MTEDEIERERAAEALCKAIWENMVVQLRASNLACPFVLVMFPEAIGMQVLSNLADQSEIPDALRAAVDTIDSGTPDREVWFGERDYDA